MFQLYQHQQKALDLTKGFRRCAYYIDMGGGKTFIGSEKMADLDARVNVLVCQKSKVQDWVDHFRKYYPQYRTFDATSKKKDEKRAYEHGFWPNWRNGRRVVPSIIVINYDLIWRRPELSLLEGFTLMLDESSLIQNHGTKRTRFILRMKPANVILLSGTPTSGRYERLWTQLHLLGWQISRKQYEQTYVIWDYLDFNTGYFIPVARGYKNVDQLKTRMRELGCIFMKTDEFGIDLPDQQDIKIRIQPTADYKKFMKTWLVTVDGREMAGDTNLTARLYARQLCGHYNKEKLAAVEDLINSTEDRLVIFYNFNAELELLKKICGDRPVSVVNGREKDLAAYERASDSVTLVQYQAGAYGLNLQKARRVIYYTLPESSELYEQSRKRIHRIGQDQKCFYYLLICADSVEEKILRALKMRRDYTDELFRTDFR